MTKWSIKQLVRLPFIFARFPKRVVLSVDIRSGVILNSTILQHITKIGSCRSPHSVKQAILAEFASDAVLALARLLHMLAQGSQPLYSRRRTTTTFLTTHQSVQQYSRIRYITPRKVFLHMMNFSVYTTSFSDPASLCSSRVPSLLELSLAPNKTIPSFFVRSSRLF